MPHAGGKDKVRQIHNKYEEFAEKNTASGNRLDSLSPWPYHVSMQTEGKTTRQANENPVIPVEALAVRFPGRQTLGYDVQGGYRNLLTGKLTVFAADEGRTIPFTVNTKTKEARFEKMPASRVFSDSRTDGKIFFLGGLPHRMLSAEDATLVVRNKVFRLNARERSGN